MESSWGFVRHLGNTPPCHLNRRSLRLPSSSLMRLTLIQDKQLPSGALNQRSDGESQAHAVAIAGQSHGRVVAALSVRKILSAAEPAMATGAFAAIRRQEHAR